MKSFSEFRKLSFIVTRMRNIISLLALTAVVSAQVYNPKEYKPNAAQTTFYANPISGNYNSNSNGARVAPVYDMALGELLKDLPYELFNPQIGFASLEEEFGALGTYHFQALNTNASTIPVQCGNHTFNATRTSTNPIVSSYEAAVTPALCDLAEPSVSTDFTCTWLVHVVSPGRDNGIKKAPYIFIQNPTVLRAPLPEWRKFATVTAGGRLSHDMNASWLQVGNCSDPDTTYWLLHPQPSHATAFTRALGQLALRAAQHVKDICVIALDQFGSGETSRLDSGEADVLHPQVGFLEQALGFSQRFYETIVAPIRADDRLVTGGFEWNSRVAKAFCVENPGLCDVLFVGTDFSNPTNTTTQSVCAYTDAVNGPFIFAPKLHARCQELGYGCTGYFPCDPTQYFNGPLILSSLGLDEDLCYEFNRSCTGTNSDRGALGNFFDTLQFPVGSLGVNLHSTYGGAQFLMADQAIGGQAAFMIRCEGLFGPGGFAQADGQEKLFSITQWTDEEKLHLNGPNQFDGIGLDAAKVTAACASVFANGTEIKQPNTVQMFAATVLSNPDEQVPTVWGVLPAALEDPFARYLHDITVDWVVNGTLRAAVNEEVILLISDMSLGELVPGVGGVGRFPLMQWQFGPFTVDFLSWFYDRLLSLGQAGGHHGHPMDAYATLAKQLLSVA